MEILTADMKQESWRLNMVFCSQICSDLQWEKNVLAIVKNLLKFETEGQDFIKKIEITGTIYSTVKGRKQFLNRLII